MDYFQALNFLRIAAVLALLFHHDTDADAQPGAGPLLVKSTEGTVHSRVGCKVTLVCSGVGKVIMWIIDGDRVENDTNIRITTWNVGNDWRSNLVFHPVLKNNGGNYGCAVIMTNSDIYTTTVLLEVETVPLEISPRIQNVDISQYHIGEVLTVGCPVDTCTEEVAVTFLRGDDVVGTTVLNHTQKIHKLNLVVDEKTAGTYACKVDINGATLIQQFNVTGTPLPALPPVIPDPRDSDSASSQRRTSRQLSFQPGERDGVPDSTLSTAAQVPLVAISVALGLYFL